MYAIEAYNATSADRLNIYIKAYGGSTTTVIGIIPQTDTSTSGTDADGVAWTGKVPFTAPMALMAVFLKSTLNDVLWLNMLVDE